jgi:hypothetical protein
MKLPTEIKVGPLIYKVVRVAPDALDGDNGDIDVNEGKIRLRKRLRLDKLKVYLLHEILHACHLHAGKYDNTPRTDEDWIDATIAPLLSVIIDNPKLIEFFQTIPEKKTPPTT